VGSNQTLSADKIQISSTEQIETEGSSTLQTQDRTIVGSHFIMQQGDTTMTFETANRSTMKSATSESSSDRAAAKFDNHTNNLLALEQAGNFQFRDSVSGRKGHAQKATVTENGDLVTLEGAPVVNTDEMQLEAGTIQLNQKNNSFSFMATQNVKTLTTADGSQPALVTSKTAHGNSDTVYYDGGVQLWRQTAYVRSEHLKLVSLQRSGQDVHHELHAEGNVKSNLGMVLASAEKLDYDESSDVAHYTGNVHARKQDMLMNSADMVVKMVDNEVSEIVSSGKVSTELSSTHHGSGDHAVYEAKTDVVTLTGPNAQMTDPDRGLVRGSRITVMNVSDKKLDKMKVESDKSERALSQQKVKQ
jgi:lipopolysaccharide transport protein LptA